MFWRRKSGNHPVWVGRVGYINGVFKTSGLIGDGNPLVTNWWCLSWEAGDYFIFIFLFQLVICRLYCYMSHTVISFPVLSHGIIQSQGT